jgi:PAS domain S-box-containing protein
MGENTLNRYHKMFHYSPVSIWEEDFSQVKACLDDCRKKGVRNFRTFFHDHPEEVLRLAQKVRIVEVNKATLDLYQAESAEDLYQGLPLVFDKETYGVFREELIALSEGKPEFSSEAVTKTVKGEERHILLHLVVAAGSENTLSQVFVYITDISSQKRIERDLRESESKYRDIVDAAYDAIFLIDAETGIILEANKRAEGLMGLPADKIVGMHYVELHPKEEAERYRKIYLNPVRHEKPLSNNLILASRQRGKIPVSLSSSVIEIKGEKCISACCREIPKEDQGVHDVDEIRGYRPNILLTAEPKRALSLREKEVLILIASGLTNKKIAEQLHVSEKTIETHRARIMKKLCVHKTADLVRHALAKGLVSKGPSESG